MSANDIPSWLYIPGEEDNIVLYSTVKLYRNIEKVHFPIYASVDEINIIEGFFMNAIEESPLNNKFENIKLSDISPLDTALHKENMTIPSNKNIIYSRLYIDKEKSNSILINSSEHCIIRSIRRGLEALECFNSVYEIEDILDKKIDFAFDKRFGYLTSSPKKIGCAMNVSLALSLPALSWWNTTSIENFIYKCESNGYRVIIKKPLEKEPIIYVVNKSMIGITERSILDNLLSIVKSIINLEKKLRNRILKIERYEIEDKIYRSHAILSSARKLNYAELIENIMWIRTGVYYGTLDISIDTINKIMILSKPYHLKALCKNYTDENLKALRAKAVRDLIKQK